MSSEPARGSPASRHKQGTIAGPLRPLCHQNEGPQVMPALQVGVEGSTQLSGTLGACDLGGHVPQLPPLGPPSLYSSLTFLLCTWRPPPSPQTSLGANMPRRSLKAFEIWTQDSTGQLRSLRQARSSEALDTAHPGGDA